MSITSPPSPRLKNPSDLRLLAEVSMNRRKEFQKSLLKLGGLKKHQRRLVTALVEEFWQQNSSESLDASLHIDNEGETIQNGMKVPRLSNTDGFTAPKLGKRCRKKREAISDSSETDSSSDSSVRSVNPVKMKNHCETTNKFEILEVSCTESESDQDTDATEGANTDLRISELEQIVLDKTERIKHLELELSDRTTRIHSLTIEVRELSAQREQLTRKNTVISTLEAKCLQLENKIKAHSKEQIDNQNHYIHRKKVIKQAITSSFLPAINNIVKCKTEEKLSQSSLLSSFLSNPNKKEEVYNKTRVEFLTKDPVNELEEFYHKNELVPISSIRRLNQITDFDYEAYLRKILIEGLEQYQCYRENKSVNND